MAGPRVGAAMTDAPGDATARRIRIGHSPDPDDAFMFHALTSGAIATPGYEFVHELQDIETLNRRAFAGDLEVSAISIHAYPLVSERYALMNCGASMGEGYGPMVIAREALSEEAVRDRTIAVPGMHTSALLGLRLAWGDVDVAVVPFDQIIDRVVSGEFAAGLIIHEGQLTYAAHDLHSLLDLGVWWQEHHPGWPLPLGGSIVRRDLGAEVCAEVTRFVQLSIEHVLSNPDDALAYARDWGRGIDESTNEAFVRMYVNDRTLDYGPDGRSAVRAFLQAGQEAGLVGPSFDVAGMAFIGSPEA